MVYLNLLKNAAPVVLGWRVLYRCLSGIAVPSILCVSYLLIDHLLRPFYTQCIRTYVST